MAVKSRTRAWSDSSKDKDEEALVRQNGDKDKESRLDPMEAMTWWRGKGGGVLILQNGAKIVSLYKEMQTKRCYVQ